MTLSDDDFAFFVECIEHDDPKERAFALTRRRDVPSGDERVLPYIERCLEDDTVCLVMLPPTFGEIRHLAAEALAAERKKMGLEEPIEIDALPYPLTTDRIVALEQANGIDAPAGEEHLAARYAALRDKGLVPTRNISL